MAAPTVEGYERSYNLGTDVTVDVPSGTSEGDYLLAVHYANNSGDNMVVPLGWTAINSVDTAFMRGAWYYRESDGSDATSYTFSGDGTDSDHRFGLMLRVSGADSIDDTYGLVVSADSTNYSLPAGALTTTQDDCLLVAVGVVFGSNPANTAPQYITTPDHTQVTSSDSSSKIGVGWLIQAADGTSAAKTITVAGGTGTGWKGYIAFAPPAPISYTGSGGLYVGGTGDCQVISVFSHTGIGGLSVGGRGTFSLSFSGTGSSGLDVSGEGTMSLIFSFVGSGGLSVGGTGTYEVVQSFSFVGSGGVSVDGQGTVLLTTFTKERPLRVAGEYITEKLYNFPVSVVQNLDTTGDDVDDIVFTDATSRLPHHIDSYTDGFLSALVKMDLEANQDKDFVLRYGREAT